jgi:hypothetical protein
MNFSQAPEFVRDLKRLAKKWRSLPDDLRRAQLLVERLYVDAPGIDRNELRKAFFDNRQATVLTRSESSEVVKMRIDCASTGTKNMLRLVFVYASPGNEVTFVELFSKNDKSREDIRRYRPFVTKL